MRLDKSGSYHTGVSQHLKVSFEIAFMIAKQKIPNNIGEELITPCVLGATQILGEDAEQKMKSISLSNTTVKHRIDDIAADIKSQIINKIKLSPFFAISIIQEEIFYSQWLTAGTTSEDIFNSISNFVVKNYLDWKEFIGLCTDGAPAWIGYTLCYSSASFGFQNIATEITPDFGVGYKHCKLHQEQRFEQPDLDSDHKVLLFHTDVRWLSKGNMLVRLFELNEEVVLFLEFRENTIS
ncbi:unnamed protein product [Acanthoscelides obtectus]|uniref:Uncharacterized protein n=1 Tax=Acanthoscelides obtectus TaxID=200917 RepID=A0A9P0LWK9_ACAOB|nr:unnamed protein product [Acanthoscelides obtectus]CAK1639305.1 Zinc finger MYM-type protein 6 [Acanthoscelides obtectus]